jgi:hypothetical protein
MTGSTTKIERSAPAIRTVLAEVSPRECARFEAEFTESIARASAEFDLAPGRGGVGPLVGHRGDPGEPVVGAGGGPGGRGEGG